MHSARVSSGNTSLAVRYAALAPAEAKKKMTQPKIVSVVEFRPPRTRPAMPSSTPDRMYVPLIIRTRPTVSNSRLSNNAPMTVIATDGGLMPKPQTTVQLRSGMAERYEVVVDFAQYPPGTRIQLRNLGVPNSRDFDNTDKIMQFEVTADAFDPANNDVPAELNPQNEIMLLDETTVPGIKTVKLELHRSNSTWKVNNATWDDIVKSNYQTVVANPEPDEIQIWEIKNSSGGWFMSISIESQAVIGGI